jgi:ubiquinone/menaquinone biosynthesis C-methylase UbiE
VGWYSRIVFPRLCDFLLNRPFVARQRRELLTLAQGDVLEIGFGTGLNLACYPPHVGKITAIDPNGGMHRLARKRISHGSIAVDHQVQNGERLTFADGSFDCVVSTFTLCSIEHVSQALREIHRVLKPGGMFLFLEHGLSPEPGVQKWQKRLNWLEMRVADGCHLDRNIRELVAAEPFSSMDVSEFYVDELPGTHGYIYRGVATK